ncbi:hypothetical protein MPSEU_000419100 [Mayamaea pseudoterrestris]|nr:hypothetical protein MPSEU_000419100 [Mayamaea pseudoterrestris]
MTDFNHYSTQQYPDQLPRQRRRISQLQPDKDIVSAEQNGTASANGSGNIRRVKRRQSDPLVAKIKHAFAVIRCRQHYVWIFIYLVIVLKLLSNLYWGRSSPRSSRITRLATPSPDGSSSTATIHRSIASIKAPTKDSFSQSRASAAASSIRLPKGHLYSDPIPDFAHLDFYSLKYLPESSFFRYIHQQESAWHEEERHHQLAAIDDPNLDEEHEAFVDLDYPQPDCHRLKWADDSHPTCQHFHEFVVLDRDPDRDRLQSYSRRYLAHGYFRDAWLLEPTEHSHTHTSTMVLKTLRIERDFNVAIVANINKEALIMERMSASPRIMNIYGHCFTSMLVEHGYEISQRMVQGVEYKDRGRVTQEELDLEEKDGVKPRNNFTVEEKLEIALAMAEGVAELHGHPEGVILNDDVHPDQWLITPDGLVKFNDFNNAHIMTWNTKNSTYCKYSIWIGGDYRSPEEMDGDPIDDKSDVWPIGANLFVLLSGLYPYYSIRETKLIERTIANGTRPFLDPRYRERSAIEGGMFDIMQQCFEVDPEKRVDIFSVVHHLRQLKTLIATKQSHKIHKKYKAHQVNPVMRDLVKRIIFAEKMKLRQKEAYLQSHGNLEGFEVVSYGEYGGDNDDGSEGDDAGGDDGE